MSETDLPALRKRLAELTNWWHQDHLGQIIVDGRAWHPDEDIAQAMMVAEKIFEAGWLLTYKRFLDAHAAWFQRGDILTKQVWSQESPAMAISLAADAWLRQVKK